MGHFGRVWQEVPPGRSTHRSKTDGRSQARHRARAARHARARGRVRAIASRAGGVRAVCGRVARTRARHDHCRCNRHCRTSGILLWSCKAVFFIDSIALQASVPELWSIWRGPGWARRAPAHEVLGSHPGRAIGRRCGEWLPTAAWQSPSTGREQAPGLPQVGTAVPKCRGRRPGSWRSGQPLCAEVPRQPCRRDQSRPRKERMGVAGQPVGPRAHSRTTAAERLGRRRRLAQDNRSFRAPRLKMCPFL